MNTVAYSATLALHINAAQMNRVVVKGTNQCCCMQPEKRMLLRYMNDHVIVIVSWVAEHGILIEVVKIVAPLLAMMMVLPMAMTKTSYTVNNFMGIKLQVRLA